MQQLPKRITGEWIDSLEDESLLAAEARLHKIFFALEQEQKKLLGDKYDMMRGSEELLDAWGRWSRVSTAARARGLHLRRTARR